MNHIALHQETPSKQLELAGTKLCTCDITDLLPPQKSQALKKHQKITKKGAPVSGFE